MCVHEKRISHNIDLYASALFICEKMAGNCEQKTAMNDWCTRRKFLSHSFFVAVYKSPSNAAKRREKLHFSCCVFFFWYMCCNHFSEVNWWPFLRAFMHCLTRKCTFWGRGKFSVDNVDPSSKTWAEFIGMDFSKRDYEEMWCSVLQSLPTVLWNIIQYNFFPLKNGSSAFHELHRQSKYAPWKNCVHVYLKDRESDGENEY